MVATCVHRLVWRRGSTSATTGQAPCLVLDAHPSPRDGLEPLLWDRLARHLADAVGAGADLGERRVDLFDHLSGLVRQGEVAFALDAERVALAGLLVELHIARFVIGNERLGLGTERLELSEVGVAF